MARESVLRAVQPGEAPKRPRKKTITQAAASGTRRELLVAMRDRIAKTVEQDCPPRDLAALSRRLMEIAKEIEALDAQAGDDAAAGPMEADDEVFDADAL